MQICFVGSYSVALELCVCFYHVVSAGTLPAVKADARLLGGYGVVVL